ncbi:DMT family transporter [Hoeflea prorocentri]|uniref:DMT family transporter n=1 Tax=Hoeflea prorocentri TaxID=1922333 RepID=A0A9X3UH90_9HYPH|nr:DMT family transporter [Hoeflea prorocentri]MCY6380647.1 DMT family transporter [Hoeflea prorocentri]MDA5398447.1 DMT family transporter [Hoeflea prorocentri]
MFLVALTALIWASSFIAIKVAVPETGPYWLAASRVAIGFLVLLPYAVWKGIILPKTGRVWLLVLGMSMLNVVVPFLLISWAELSIDAGVTSLLMGTGPFFALLGSHIFTNDDKLTTGKLIGVACGFGGVLVIVGFDALAGLGRTNLLAQFACFLASLCYVIAGLILRKIDIPPGRLACLALGISTAILCVLAYLSDGLPDVQLSMQSTVALIYLGLIPTGLAYIMRFYLIRKIGYSAFAMGLNLIPVFGVLLGVVLLGETLSIRILLALLLIVCGLFIARIEPRKRMPGKTVND